MAKLDITGDKIVKSLSMFIFLPIGYPYSTPIKTDFFPSFSRRDPSAVFIAMAAVC